MLFAAATFTTQSQAQSTNIWNINYTGSIVDWTAPSTGYYHITAYGAQGGGDLWWHNSAGLGAIMGGVFQLQAGSVLKLLVGQQGFFGNVEMGGGGGGGSFVVGSNNTPLVVSGAGAGVAWGYVYSPGPYGQYTDQSYFSQNANTNTSGGSVGFSHDTSTNVIMTYGGTNGTGGNITTSGYGSGDNQGAGGGGFYGDGSSVTSGKTTWASGGQSYTSGGAGGSGGKTQDTAGTPNNGGFGGGGQGNSYGSGGGGGYSGGAGGPQVASEGDNPSFAGGGGSYLASDALHPTMSLGNTGNGQIVIATLSDLIVGDNASNQSTNFTSGTNGYNSIFVGSAPGDTNNGITVTNSGTVLYSYNNIIVGENGSANYLDVSGGGGVNSSAAGVIGLNAGANGNYVAVTGFTTHWSNGTSLTIGQSGSSNSLAIQEGGLVTVGGAGGALGYNAGSSGNSLLVDGAGSSLANSSDFVVGFSGSGNTAVVSGGGILTNGQHSYGGVIGLNSGASNNSVLVTGSGSAWHNGGDLLVGWGDSGNTLTVSNGGAVTSSQDNYGGAIGFQAGSTGNNIAVTGTGSSWINSGDLLVGVSGSGNSMVIANGGSVANGQVNYGGVLGFNAASSNNSVLVTGTGSSWSNSGDLLVGVSGSGNSMVITNGGTVANGQVNYGGVIGWGASSSNNSVLVTGAGSTWSNSGALTIGSSGSGTLTIANGGSVSASSITIASQVGSTGTLNFGSLGGSDTAGSLIGPGISFGSGSGTINFNQVDSLIGSGFSGNGSLNQLGSGTTILTGTNTYGGTTTINGGTLVVQGQSSLGTSSVTLNGGTLMASGVFTEFPLALNGGTMNLAGSGSSWNTGANTLIVGNNSPGVSLVVSSGASLTSGSGILGQDSGASNNSILVTGTGSTWTNESYLYVGDRSSGNSVKVSAGGTVSVFALYIGNYGSGNSLEVSDGGQLVTGGDYWGSCNIGFATSSSNNSVLVTGSGSSWNNNSTMYIGYEGSGAVTLANGGSMTAGYLRISGYGGSGALNIGRLGSNDTAGTFSAWSLALGTGGVINFNQSDSTTLSTVISGNGSVNQLGNGTTILTGNNGGYNGVTTVSAGTLLANSGNALGTSLVTVTNSGTLGGNGTIGGVTTIASGGSLTPGSSGAGALSFSAGLTLESGSTTTFLINAPGNFTSINILGNNINFGGELIFNIASYTPTAGDAFTLFNMTGGATQSGSFSSVSAGSLFFTESGGIWSASYGDYAYQFSQSTGQLSVEASQAVPEPSTYALLGLGALALLIAYRRKSRKVV